MIYNETYETHTVYSPETLAVLGDLAKWYDTCASNVRANNHNQNPKWEGRAGGFEQAAYYVRVEIKEHSPETAEEQA